MRFSLFFLSLCFFYVFAADAPVRDPFQVNEPKLIAVFIPIHYANARTLSTLLQTKEHHLLSERGILLVDERTNNLWIQDTLQKITALKKIIKGFDVPVKQIIINARIVNAEITHESEIGFRFGLSRARHLSGTLAGANAIAQGTQVSAVPLEQRLNFNMPANTLFSTPAQMGLAVAKLGGGVLIDMELSAMEQENLLEIVASPRLLASHQKPALIESGSEIPYAESTKEGATTATFRKAVLSLKVTPQVTEENKILLTLEVNQDRPGVETTQGILIHTEHMKTQVLIKQKETIVVGGIYETTQKNFRTRIPYLSDIPLIGRLFQHHVLSHVRKELLIFITPEII